MSVPLSEYERRIRDHAILASTAFLILLPIGVLIPRYFRTFSNRWWWLHWFFCFFLSAPIVYAALAMAVSANHISHNPIDHHKRVGYTIFTLYTLQLLLGILIHTVRTPSLFILHRPPQNYIHAAFGVTIFVMAGCQVNYGLYTQWKKGTKNVHLIPESAKQAWLALLTTFWVLYCFGLLLIPRQYRQEKEGRLLKQDKPEEKS